MTRLLLALLIAAPSATMAQGRPSTTAMSCASANALVISRRAIVLGTGGDTYDRFVAEDRECPAGLQTLPAFVPSADNPQCFVGYRCITRPNNER